MSAIFYNFSGGMESAAMLVLDLERIKQTGAIIRYADTGKQFPEAYTSFRQIEHRLGVFIQVPSRRITFDEFLFEKGGMVRKGTTDCSRRMKRSNLTRHLQLFPKPWEVNLGFNVNEADRAEAFTDRNERPWLHWRFPLIEKRITRERTWEICRAAGFTVLVEMYEKMGRMDCYFCGNQKPEQALKVYDHYPELAKEWMANEERKGHSFLPVSLKVLVENRGRQGLLEWGTGATCACFGGADEFAEETA
jgi:hypothetical protein